MRGPRAGQGFSLIELLVAAGVATLMAASLTAAVANAQRAAGGAQAADRREAAAAALWEQLRALPYCTAVPGGAGSILQRVFPHADVSRNVGDAWFSPQACDGRPAGTFFSSAVLDGVPLSVAATFCTAEASGWQPLAPELLAGYSPDQPPAANLMLSIRPVQDGAGAGGLLVIVPDRPPASDPVTAAQP